MCCDGPVSESRDDDDAEAGGDPVLEAGAGAPAESPPGDAGPDRPESSAGRPAFRPAPSTGSADELEQRDHKAREAEATAGQEFADPVVARRFIIWIALAVFVANYAFFPVLDVPTRFVWDTYVDLAYEPDQRPFYYYPQGEPITDTLNNLRNKSYDLTLFVFDWLSRTFASRQPVSRVVIVSIDEEALEKYGRWPWKRAVTADLVRGLDALGAPTVAVDAMLGEPETTLGPGLKRLVERYPASEDARLLGRLLERIEAPEEVDLDAIDPFRGELRELVTVRSGDRKLAEAIRNSGNVLLGGVRVNRSSTVDILDWEHPGEKTAVPANVADYILRHAEGIDQAYVDEAWREGLITSLLFEDAGFPQVYFGGIGDRDLFAKREKPASHERQEIQQQFARVAASFQVPLADFQEAAAGFGYMNDEESHDGAVRGMSLLTPIGEYAVPSLSLAALAHSRGGHLELWLDAQKRLREVRIVKGEGPGRTVLDRFPCDRTGRFWLNFYGRDTFAQTELPSVKARRAFEQDMAQYRRELEAGGDPVAPDPQDAKYQASSWTKDSGVGVTSGRFSRVSAAKVLDALHGKLEASRRLALERLFENSIVFVGVTAVGLSDIRATALGDQRPGVEMHATAASNLLDGSFLQLRDEEEIFAMALCFAFLATLALVMPRVTPYQAFLITTVMVLLAGGLCLGCIALGSVIYPFDLMFPTVLFYLLGMAYLNRFENKEKAWIDSMFKRYVSAAYVEEIKRNKGQLDLHGRESEITAFFSDMAKFSTISEAFSAEGLFRFLGEYLGEMADILDRHGGTLDKFEGDAVVAFFGAPIATTEHASMACLSALEMQRRILELEADWQTNGRYPELLQLQEKLGHWFPIRVRIGLNSGICATGHLGTADRGNYTMMGDNVNLAARLESAGKQYGIRLTVSEDTYYLAHEVVVGREVDYVRVVGKTVPTRIFEVVAPRDRVTPEEEVFLGIYGDALARYKDRDFAGALETFKNALRRRGDDRPTQIYVERCERFLAEPPPPDWDGVAVLTEK